jgi:hypothetical protein
VRPDLITEGSVWVPRFKGHHVNPLEVLDRVNGRDGTCFVVETAGPNPRRRLISYRCLIARYKPV